ncbi:MAG: cobyric acid synthase [Planctomycetota bacterium]|nr:cobyric acid synthase [Planctomycetota bacterium]
MNDPAVTHGGNIRELRAQAGDDLIDASANINPCGPPEWLRPVIARAVGELVHYPDPDCLALREAIAERHGIAVSEVVVGNGSSELFSVLPQVLAPTRWLVPVPCYGEYRRAPVVAGRELVEVPGCGLEADWDAIEQTLAAEPAVVIVGHPNNPTGRLADTKRIRQAAAAYPASWFVIDEAFAEFVTDFQSLVHERPSNVVVMRSATKIAAIPGLRLGWLIAAPALTKAVQRALPPWSVNTLAQAVGCRLMDDADFIAESRAQVQGWRSALVERLTAIDGVRALPGQANWVLVELLKATAAEVVARCLKQGVALRDCSDYPGLGGRFVRIAVRRPGENDKVATVLAGALGVPQRNSRPAKQHRAIMLQGCSSDAGKSVLVAALGRCLAQDGVAVAPFKSQNMSNNSGVDRDGLELGRAQVMQAMACGVEPDARMNPILLKPNSDTGCQVVLRGRPIGNHDVAGYHASRQRCLDGALAAYDELAADYDVLVCEGAGSPGEVNLKRRDIVNMGFVRHREMPVALIGDIDRGGVYASFVGHMEVLDEWERSMVRGFLVNRFRGDQSLLAPAHEYVEAYTGVPVLGTVPFLHDLGLPDEDRVALSRGERKARGRLDAAIDIAVIGFHHISNFTDVDCFTIEPDVSLRIVERPGELGTPDAIILPGTKNTIGDLTDMRSEGLADAVLARFQAGAELVGLCGGYQMLGRRIADPETTESSASVAEGLGLLAIDTVMAADKCTRQIRARHVDAQLPVHGYEIHHGVTVGDGAQALVVGEDGQVLGVRSTSARVWGSYIHGLFDDDAFRRWWIDQLRVAKGMAALATVQASYDLEPAFDRLAACFRESVDLPAIYRMIGID